MTRKAKIDLACVVAWWVLLFLILWLGAKTVQAQQPLVRFYHRTTVLVCGDAKERYKVEAVVINTGSQQDSAPFRVKDLEVQTGIFTLQPTVLPVRLKVSPPEGFVRELHTNLHGIVLCKVETVTKLYEGTEVSPKP